MRKKKEKQTETLEIIKTQKVLWSAGFGSRIAERFITDGEDLNKDRVRALIGRGLVEIKTETPGARHGRVVAK